MISAALKQTRRFLSGFRRDRRGVSAVEFALIAPVMIALYLSAVEMSLALTIDRKITGAASAMADLVAQDDIITDDEIADILSAGGAIVAPFDASLLRVRVTNVYMDFSGEVAVEWSDADGMAPHAEGSTVTVPNGVLNPNRSIVMVEVAYDYETLFDILGLSGFEISETFYLRPRQSIVVTRA